MQSATHLSDILRSEGRSQAWLAMKLAARLGRDVYRQEVHRWCRGLHEPEESTKAVIAEVLGRPVGSIAYGESEATAA